MSLECLAILGIKNEPLFMYEPLSAKKRTKDEEVQEDVFGFSEAEIDGPGISIRNEVRVLVSMVDHE